MKKKGNKNPNQKKEDFRINFGFWKAKEKDGEYYHKGLLVYRNCYSPYYIEICQAFIVPYEEEVAFFSDNKMVITKAVEVDVTTLEEV